MEGSGFTVIVKVCVRPSHEVLPFIIVGVTVIVAITGGARLVAVKGKMLPCPLEGKPMLVSLFVQLKIVPGSFDSKIIGCVESRWQ